MKNLLISGALPIITKKSLDGADCELIEVDNADNSGDESWRIACMMDIPDYLKSCKPKGRSKADRKRSPRWPRR